MPMTRRAFLRAPAALASAALLLAACLAPATTAAQTRMPAADEARIRAELAAANERYATTQAAGDLVGFGTLLSDDYLYIDISGKRVDKAMLLARRGDDKRVPVETVSSEEELIVLSPTVVLQRGREDQRAEYFGGLPRQGATRFSALWTKEADGEWRVLGEQVTPLVERSYAVKVRVPIDAAALARFAGDYRLATRTPLVLRLAARDGALHAAIEGQFDDMAFHPEAPDRFYATDRDFQLRFAADAGSLVITTWGLETRGERIVAR